MRYTITENNLRNIIKESISKLLREYEEEEQVPSAATALAEYLGIDTNEIQQISKVAYQTTEGEYYIFDSVYDAEEYVMDPYGYDAARFMKDCWSSGQEFYNWLQKNPNSAAYYDMEEVFPDLKETYTDEVYNDETGEYEEVEYDPHEMDMEVFTNNVDWNYVAQVVLDVDGPEWYLAGYDGAQIELPYGFVGYRYN